MRRIRFGMLAKDVVTGFTGRVIVIAHYWTGGTKVALEPENLTEDGQPQVDQWFPVERIEIVDPEPLRLPGESADSLLGELEF